MKKKGTILLIIALLAPLCLVAENAERRHSKASNMHLQYRVSGTIGWLNRDDKIVGDARTTGLTLDRPVVLGGTFAVEFLPGVHNTALRQWNNASIGLAFTALDLGQNQYLGQAFAPHVYVNVPLVTKRHFVFGLRPGLGVAFVTKTYANTVPDSLRWKAYRVPSDGPKEMQQIANVSVGSIANAWITAGAYMDFPINDNWIVNFTLAWQHISNGSVMTPNAGYNMFNAELGCTYRPSASPKGRAFYEPPTMVPHRLYEGVDKKWSIDIGLAGGIRSVYYQDQKWFGVGSFGIAAFWNPVSIFRLGGGFDLYYDGAYAYTESKFGKTYIPESKIENCFRLGVSLQPEMVLGNLTFGYHIGIYLYDPVKNMEPYKEAKNGLNRGIFYAYDPMKASTYQDGWCYQKLQVKYLCTKHMYVQLGLKLHIMKAEFVDLGLGIRL